MRSDARQAGFTIWMISGRIAHASAVPARIQLECALLVFLLHGAGFSDHSPNPGLLGQAYTLPRFMCSPRNSRRRRATLAFRFELAHFFLAQWGSSSGLPPSASSPAPPRGALSRHFRSAREHAAILSVS